MELSKNGAELIKAFEKFISRPYLDAVGVPTIGWGTTYYPDGRKVTMKDAPITIEQGNLIFEQVFKKDFAKHIPTNNINQNQFDALGSIIYNIGASNFVKSTLLKKVKANPNDVSIRDEFARWNKARRNNELIILKGLTIRREKEADLYFKPIQ